jgi:integrase
MARTTVYNDDLSQEWQLVNKENQKLVKEFIRYCTANNKSPQTCNQYEAQLKIFFCWNYKENDDKFFVNIKKRELISFFGWGNEIGWSPCRLASLRAVLSSLSNYIERILDDDYPQFRNIVKVLEPIHLTPVREKTIIDKDDIMAGVDKLVEISEYQYACFLALLFSSGMRKSEVSQMKVSFFTTNQKIVFKGLAYETPKIRTKGRGTIGKQVPRYVFKETFEKYLNLWLEQREKLGITTDALFVIKSGTKYQPAKTQNFTHWAAKIGELIGVKSLYCHSLRHAFTTYLKRQNFPTDVVQKIQSWSSADMVARYDDRSDSEELDEFFGTLQSGVNIDNKSLEEK